MQTYIDAASYLCVSATWSKVSGYAHTTAIRRNPIRNTARIARLLYSGRGHLLAVYKQLALLYSLQLVRLNAVSHDVRMIPVVLRGQ